MFIETNCRKAEILKESTPPGVAVRIGRQTAYGTDENDTPAIVFVYVRDNKGAETRDGFVDWLMNDEFGPEWLTISARTDEPIKRERASLEKCFDLEFIGGSEGA